jgi:hypothetical protein
VVRVDVVRVDFRPPCTAPSCEALTVTGLFPVIVVERPRGSAAKSLPPRMR